MDQLAGHAISSEEFPLYGLELTAGCHTRCMMHPPIVVPTMNATRAVSERSKESPGTRAAANARSTTLSVMFTVNTRPSARKLTPSIMPVTAAIPSNGSTSRRPFLLSSTGPPELEMLGLVAMSEKRKWSERHHWPSARLRPLRSQRRSRCCQQRLRVRLDTAPT